MPTASKPKLKYALDFYEIDPIDNSFEYLPMRTEEHSTFPHVNGRNVWKQWEGKHILTTYGVATNLETGVLEMAWTGEHSTLLGLHLLGVTPQMTTNPVTTPLVFMISQDIYYFEGDTSNLEALAYQYRQDFTLKGKLCENIKESNAKTRHRRRSELFESRNDYQAYLFGARVYVLYQLSKHSEFKQVVAKNPAVGVWI